MRRARKAVAHLLCEIGRRMRDAGYRDGEATVPLTQCELEAMTGLTSVHVNRTLRDLREAGLIGSGPNARGVVIRDPHSLERLASFDDGRARARGPIPEEPSRALAPGRFVSSAGERR